MFFNTCQLLLPRDCYKMERICDVKSSGFTKCDQFMTMKGKTLPGVQLNCNHAIKVCS